MRSIAWRSVRAAAGAVLERALIPSRACGAKQRAATTPLRAAAAQRTGERPDEEDRKRALEPRPAGHLSGGQDFVELLLEALEIAVAAAEGQEERLVRGDEVLKLACLAASG
jgi:hypothetical protein